MGEDLLDHHRIFDGIADAGYCLVSAALAPSPSELIRLPRPHQTMQALAVVCQAYQLPLTVNFGLSVQVKSGEAEYVLDNTEHRFDRLLS